MKPRSDNTSVDFLQHYGNSPKRAAKPKTLDETIELANDLMDRKLLTYSERQSDNKRKADDSFRNNHGHQQQPFKRQNVAKAYNMETGERKPYGGSLPKCHKCHLHHNGPCTQRCYKCNKIGHFARDCRSTGNTNVANTQKGNGATPKGNGCFECGAPGHFKRDCPKLKNKNGGNGNAQGWVYAVGNAEKRGNAPGNPDANVVTALLDQDIDLMPRRTGSFHDINGMDWLKDDSRVIVATGENPVEQFILISKPKRTWPRDAGLFGTISRQERGGQIFLQLDRLEISNRLSFHSCTRRHDTIFELPQPEMKELSEQLQSFLQGIHKTEIHRLGTPVLYVKKKAWIVQDVTIEGSLKDFRRLLSSNDETYSKGIKFVLGEKEEKRFPVDKSQKCAVPQFWL
ncbi:putative reverse transcriptase domain-containing protein [Tanacetum coccineum]